MNTYASLSPSALLIQREVYEAPSPLVGEGLGEGGVNLKEMHTHFPRLY